MFGALEKPMTSSFDGRVSPRVDKAPQESTTMNAAEANGILRTENKDVQTRQQDGYSADPYTQKALQEKLLVYPDPQPSRASTSTITKPLKIDVVDEVYQLCATCTGYSADSTKHDCSSAVAKPAASPSPASAIIQKLTKRGDSVIDEMLAAVQSFLSDWSDAPRDQGCHARFYLKDENRTIDDPGKAYVRIQDFAIMKSLKVTDTWVQQGLERRLEEFLGFKAGVEGHGLKWQFLAEKNIYNYYEWLRIDFELPH